MLIENSTINLTFPHSNVFSDISTTLDVSPENSDQLSLQSIPITDL